jgi:zinc transport system substrate-binding protein
MKQLLVIMMIVIALVWCCDCSGPGEKPASGTVIVAVSVFPVYDIARNVCGKNAETFFVIPAGADPHTYEPLPSIARQLEGTSLFIGISHGFDGWMENYLPKKACRAYIIDEKTRKKGNANPHIWLSVRESKKIASMIARNLCLVDPKHADQYGQNLDVYTRKLDVLDKTIEEIFRNSKNKSFIQWHEAWNYFAADYGLTIAGTVEREGSDKASVRSIKDIVERAKRDRVTTVAVSLNAEDRTARVLAGEIGGEIVRLDGIGDPGSSDRPDYINLMLYNAKALAQSLR